MADPEAISFLRRLLRPSAVADSLAMTKAVSR